MEFKRYQLQEKPLTREEFLARRMELDARFPRRPPQLSREERLRRRGPSIIDQLELRVADDAPEEASE